jgi:hypothetical protein
MAMGYNSRANMTHKEVDLRTPLKILSNNGFAICHNI